MIKLKINNTRVAKHPNDTGMELIAQRIFNTIDD